MRKARKASPSIDLAGRAHAFAARHFFEGLGWNDLLDEPLRQPDYRAAADEILALPADECPAFLVALVRAMALECDVGLCEDLDRLEEELSKRG